MSCLALDLIDEHRRARVLWPPPPADDHRLDELLERWSNVQEASTLWRRQPLMTVAPVKIDAQCAQVKIDLARRMRSVDDRPDTGRPCAGDQWLDRQRDRGRRRDVAHEQDACSGRDAFPDRL